MRFTVFAVVLMTLMALILPACEQKPPELLGCKPDIKNITVSDGGPAWAIINAEIAIANPNDYPVTADGLNLKMDSGNGIQTYEEVLKKFEIPAKGTVTQVVSCNVTFMNIVSDMAMNKALPGATAVGYAAAIWKVLGAAKPGMIPQAAWDGLPPATLAYTYETAVYTRANGLQKWVKTTGKWPK